MAQKRTSSLGSIPTVWTAIANQLIADNTLGYIYRSPDNSKLYVFNQKTNNTMAARLWLSDPRITHFKEVFHSGEVKVFKVVP